MSVVEKELLDLNVDIIRSEIPSLNDIVFFNSAWTGPAPKQVINAIQNSLLKQIKFGPSSKEAVREQVSELLQTKSKIASFFSCKKENICLTTGTTLGINFALNAFDWETNSEILVTKSDHASAIIPLYNLRERYGVKVKIIDLDENNPTSSFLKNITRSTRAAVFCHVFWTNGNVIPLKEIVQELRKKGIISIIDAAQSAGAMNINLGDLAPDFYSVPGQKWLLGPVGTGFLYVHEQYFNKRPPWPSIVGYESAGDASNDELYDLNYSWYPKKDAGVFEFGGLNNSLFCGFASAIEFAMKNSSELNIYERIYLLAEHLRGKLKEEPDIIVITTVNHAGIISWQHKKLSSGEVVSKLWKKKRILIREIASFNICRASLHYFNTKEEIDFLLESLKDL